MVICIVGWYGTETLGDRAILDGIFRIFEKIKSHNSYLIGSLYPVLTERTILEDSSLYKTYSDFSVETFDVHDSLQLNSMIKKSDIVIMGGGPLMDLRAMYVVKHAFAVAKKMEKITGLIGCGYGPLNSTEYELVTKEIIKLSDITIMRSNKCCERAKKLVPNASIYVSVDPAEISVLSYRAYSMNSLNCDFSVANIRDLDYVYGTKNKYYKWICDYIEKCASVEEELMLVPMHTYAIGGDDRQFQNEVCFELKKKNIHVIQKPLALNEMYDMVRNAHRCYGMRYHSVVFHTLLNGNNYIANYTDSKNGKIISFLKDISGEDFYMDGRYISYDEMTTEFVVNERKFDSSEMDVNKMVEQYVFTIKTALNN